MGKNYRMPGHTCPSIDRAIRELNELIGTEVVIKSDISRICDQLEDLRSDNSALRCAAESAIADVEILENQVSELEDELATMPFKVDSILDEQRLAILAELYEQCTLEELEAMKSNKDQTARVLNLAKTLEEERRHVVALNKELTQMVTLRNVIAGF